jgi:hypothetical protein
MNYLAGLNNFTDQDKIRRGARELVNVALNSHAGLSTSAPRVEAARTMPVDHGDDTRNDGQQMDDDDPKHNRA